MNTNIGTIEYVSSLMSEYKTRIERIHNVKRLELQSMTLLPGKSSINLNTLQEELEQIAATTIIRLRAYLDTVQLHEDN